MSEDLKALYQEIILKHNKAPIGKGEAPENWVHAEGRNPTCGDEVRLALDIDLETGTVREVRFQGASCAICTASTSMLVEAVSGKSAQVVVSLKKAVLEGLEGGDPLEVDLHGDLHALNGVQQFPARLRCARLPWDVLEKALSETDV
ncbi:MAG: Fe-S cluster assembly sulfur transfer protein SufU [Opitutales bacterium]